MTFQEYQHMSKSCRYAIEYTKDSSWVGTTFITTVVRSTWDRPSNNATVYTPSIPSCADSHVSGRRHFQSKQAPSGSVEPTAVQELR